MIVFIVVPNNKSLANYVDITLQYLGNPSKDRVVVSRGEDVPFIIEELSQNGKRIIGLTGRDLFKEYELSKYNTNIVVLKTINWDDQNAMFGKPVLCLLGPKGKKLEDLPKNLRVSINSKYKNLAKKYNKYTKIWFHQYSLFSSAKISRGFSGRICYFKR